MPEREASGVKHLPGYVAQFRPGLYVCGIDFIAQHGMSDGHHVLANLVSPSRFNVQLEMAGDPIGAQDRQARDGGLPVDRRRDFPQVSLNLAGDDGMIGLRHAMAFEQLNHDRLRVRMLCAQKASRGVTIQAVDSLQRRASCLASEPVFQAVRTIGEEPRRLVRNETEAVLKKERNGALSV